LIPNFEAATPIKSVPTIEHMPMPSSLAPVWPTATKQTFLPTKKQDFMDTLSILSKINPPNAVSSIESLFSNPKFSIDANMAIIQDTPTVMLGPHIKIVPIESSDLKLSLITFVPMNQELNQGGVLKLDMNVFKATWLS
jgi:hypothetical protein